MLALLLAAPAPADEPAAPSIDTGAARKINYWKAKGSLHPRAASTLKDTSSNLKWRPYRKQKTVSGMARRPQTAISPKLPRLAPQRAVRLIAAGPTLDRFALQPRSGDTKPNERAFPPPSERPQTDVPSLPKPESASDPLGRPPIDLFPKDDPPKELPQPKELPDVAPKVEQLPFDIAPGKQPVAEPEAKASDQPLRKEDGPQGDAVEMKTDKYRLAKIGELSIDITPAPKSRTWNLRVDKEGNLIVYIPPNGIGAGGDEKDPSLDAVLVDIVDGQVTLREMLSPKGQGDQSVGAPVEGRLLTFSLEKLTEDDRTYVNERLNKKVWTHRSRKYEFYAIFVRLRGWLVDLRTDDGKIVSLPLDEFVLEDQQMVLDFWGLPATHQQPQVEFTGRDWAPIDYTWTASALCHKPLYFEQVQLERYGHSLGPYLQPIASGAHFFLSVPALPYKMGVDPPNECVYALGYYRPGSCAPYLVPPLPISLRGALYQGGVVTGLVFLIP